MLTIFNRKLVGLLVVCSLLIAVGCTAKRDSGTSVTETSSSTSSSSSSSSTETPDSEGKKDYGEAVIVMPFWFSQKSETDKVRDYIKEQSGVYFNEILGDSSVNKFTLMIASGEKVDASWGENMMGFTTLLKNDSLLPLGDLLDQYGQNVKSRIAESSWDWVKDENGEIYGIPLESFPVSDNINIRQDWLDTLNLEIPKTIAEFEQVLIKFRDHYKTAPLIMQETFDKTLGGSFLPHGYSWWKSEDGQYLPPELQPEYKEYLATLHSWYAQGLIQPENFVGKMFEVHNNLVSANKVGAMIGWYSYPYGQSGIDLHQRVPEAEWSFTQPLKGAYDLGYIKNEIVNDVFVVSKNAANPEGVIRLYDWQAESLVNLTTGRWGIPGEHWNWLDESKGIVETVPDLGDKLAGGHFQLLNANGYSDRPDTSSDIGYKWTYRYVDFVNDHKIDKLYTPIEQQARIVDGLLESSSVQNAVNTAANEAKIAIITGSKPVDYWDEFVIEWKKIGVDLLIKEKGAAIAERMDQ